MAHSRGLKISELAKEMLSAGIAGSKSGLDASANLLARIEQLEATVLGAQTWLTDVVITNLRVTAGARYYARLGTENSDEVISYPAVLLAAAPNHFFQNGCLAASKSPAAQPLVF